MEGSSKIILTFAVAMMVGACAKVDFAPVPDAAQIATGVDPVKTVVCGPNQVKVTRPTRVLFVVDQSGSNVNGPYEAPGMATDPQKTFRTTVMQDFYQSNQGKTNLSWGLDVFNNQAAANLMKNSSGVAVPFSSSAINFNNAMSLFVQRTDVGDTPYKAALNLVKQTISNDMPTAPKYVNYLIAFMTDGYPTDYCPGGPSEVSCIGHIMEANIDADVKAIKDMASGSVQFSTVYYGKADSDAAKRLQRMAQIGGGDFIDTNTTTHVNLNDILEVEQEVCVEK